MMLTPVMTGVEGWRVSPYVPDDGFDFCGARAPDGTTGGHYREGFFRNNSVGWYGRSSRAAPQAPGASRPAPGRRRPVAASWDAWTTHPRRRSNQTPFPEQPC